MNGIRRVRGWLRGLWYTPGRHQGRDAVLPAPEPLKVTPVTVLYGAPWHPAQYAGPARAGEDGTPLDEDGNPATVWLRPLADPWRPFTSTTGGGPGAR